MRRAIVKLSKTYDFEGDKISELAFSGMENVRRRKT